MRPEGAAPAGTAAAQQSATPAARAAIRVALVATITEIYVMMGPASQRSVRATSTGAGSWNDSSRLFGVSADPAPAARPAGIDGSGLPGPFPVGSYAAQLKRQLNSFARVQLFGEVSNVRTTRVRVYFELRDASGAVPCSMWRNRYDTLGLTPASLVDGAQVVVAGGCDYYAGSRTASPSFSFDVGDLRVAGEGDLLAQIDRLRKQLDAEGLLEPQKRLPRVALPRAIGIVTGETGKARDDICAALARRGWQGRVVWAFARVQDRRAAPEITRALQDLAASGAVDAIVVARGGGSQTDLMAFSDETLCRTVALLPVPVIASVGHHTDRNLIDDVAAESCSTPTHAAEAAVPVNVREARASMTRCASALAGHGRRAVLVRARSLAQLSRAPAEHVARHRRDLHQRLREMRASARRRVGARSELAATHALVIARAGERAQATIEKRTDLARLIALLDAHDPERTLERGYALVAGPGGEVVTSAEAARAARDVTLRFADATVPATVEDAERE
jgi:exodeoxyribonuclease VII large subunit